MKRASTKKRPSKKTPHEMRPEHDFFGGGRGKDVEQYRRGTNLVLLDPALADAFPRRKR